MQAGFRTDTQIANKQTKDEKYHCTNEEKGKAKEQNSG